MLMLYFPTYRGEPLRAELQKKVDMLLAADCVYFEPAFPLLVQTLVDLVHEDTEVLFCYKKRRKVWRAVSKSC